MKSNQHGTVSVASILYHWAYMAVKVMLGHTLQILWDYSCHTVGCIPVYPADIQSKYC